MYVRVLVHVGCNTLWLDADLVVKAIGEIEIVCMFVPTHFMTF